MAENKMEKLIALCKRRGFIYPGSEIYGGLANTYDYGPVGVELLRNIKNLWWDYFVHARPDIVGIDGSIISHHKIWEASGHVSGFADAMVDCKHCKARYRADHLIEHYLEDQSESQIKALAENIEIGLETTDLISSKRKLQNALRNKKVEGLAPKELGYLINYLPVFCPECKIEPTAWTSVRKFNLLFPVQLGIVEGEGGMGYLRGETAQLIFTNFRNVVDSTRVKLPFGIAQLGKSFRNEITPGNSVFRTIEFEQGEIEYFFNPRETDWEYLFDEWKRTMDQFVTGKLGIKSENLRWRRHTDAELSFYSKRTEDMEYKFPFGFKELWGLAYRTDYDLARHMEASGQELVITDPKSGEKILPHVIEPAVGINRLLLMILIDAYTEEAPSAGSGQANRTVLKISPKVAPYKVAVFPLLANKEALVGKAREIFSELQKSLSVSFDDRGNIGKRYLYQDEIGTPWCVTVDFDSLEDDAVTVRDRDSMQQERVPVTALRDYFLSKLA